MAVSMLPMMTFGVVEHLIPRMAWSSRFARLLVLSTLVTSAGRSLQAQDARARVQQAVNTELAADATDKSNWSYHDHDVQPGKDEVAVVIETPQGSVQRVVERFGKPLDAAQRQVETSRIDETVHDSSLQAKRKHDGQKDDDSAHNLLAMLPQAFIWTVAGEDEENTTFAFKPDPSFNPPSIESRVFAAMEGEMVVDRRQQRIRILRGTLTQDVKIGFGFLGRLKQGGTFEVTGRQLAPRIWQITESHVHIDGRALLFKTIGQQEDEVKTDFQPSTARTLVEAEEQLQGVQ
jgi:hypothetical protein